MYICLQHRANLTTSGETLEVLPLRTRIRKGRLLLLLLSNFVLEILISAIAKRGRKGNEDGKKNNCYLLIIRSEEHTF